MRLLILPCCGRKRADASGVPLPDRPVRDFGSPHKGVLERRRELAGLLGEAEGADLGASGVTPALLPAAERYNGNLYRQITMEAWQRTYTSPTVRVVIVSALYGLLLPDEPIRYYNRAMTDTLPTGGTVARWWKDRGLARLLAEHVARVGADEVHDFLSGAYRVFSEEIRVKNHVKHTYPGLGVGSDHHRGKDVQGLLIGGVLAAKKEKPLHERQTDLATWAQRIRAEFAQFATLGYKSVIVTIRMGKLLIAAKKQHPGKWTDMFDSKALPFSQSKACILMTIARNPVLSDLAHARNLPRSWTTLHRLAKLHHDVLRAALENGTLHPGIKRSQVTAYGIVQNGRPNDEAPWSVERAREEGERLVANAADFWERHVPREQAADVDEFLRRHADERAEWRDRLARCPRERLIARLDAARHWPSLTRCRRDAAALEGLLDGKVSSERARELLAEALGVSSGQPG